MINQELWRGTEERKRLNAAFSHDFKGSEFVYDENLCEDLWDLPYDITAGEVKALLLE